MTNAITHLDALEILDSRGVPTLQVELGLDSGVRVTASVPSGASTGIHEAHELRDREPHRYGGRGVLTAAANVRDVIGPALIGRDTCEQEALDRQMIEFDGTDNKSRLGANAILGVSMAAARAAAVAKRMPLYVHFADGAPATLLPCPMMNVINGGLHAKNELEFQEFMIVPHGAPKPALFADATDDEQAAGCALCRLDPSIPDRFDRGWVRRGGLGRFRFLHEIGRRPDPDRRRRSLRHRPRVHTPGH